MKKNSGNDPECVKVALRCRPLSDSERTEGHKEIVRITPERGEVLVKSSKSDETDKMYTFDMVFEPSCEQESIFKQAALPIIESVLEGYNGTIFAYGQTGTGKTHTMEGLKNNPKELGIIPRTFAHLFKSIEGNCLSIQEPLASSSTFGFLCSNFITKRFWTSSNPTRNRSSTSTRTPTSRCTSMGSLRSQ